TVSFPTPSTTVREGDVTLSYVIGLSRPSGALASPLDETLTIPITVGGTATYFSDYTITGTGLTHAFPNRPGAPTLLLDLHPGATSGLLQLVVHQDSVSEGNTPETVTLSLGSPYTAHGTRDDVVLGATWSYVLKIQDDDQPFVRLGQLRHAGSEVSTISEGA